MSGSQKLKIHTRTHPLISISNSICSVYWVSTLSNSLYRFFNLQMHFTRLHISSEVNTNWDIQFQISPEQEFPDIRCKHTFIHFSHTHACLQKSHSHIRAHTYRILLPSSGLKQANLDYLGCVFNYKQRSFCIFFLKLHFK